MACACKVSQQLSYIEKKYGTKTKKSKKTSITVMAKVVLNSILTGVIVILAAPVMLISVLFAGKVIDVNKVFGIRQHERYQQNI